jgi:hypothetical protein
VFTASGLKLGIGTRRGSDDGGRGAELTFDTARGKMGHREDEPRLRHTIVRMLHAVTVRPFRIREPSHVLGCDLIRGVGYRWECSCGERGKVMGDWRSAQMDKRRHLALAAST